MTTTSINTRNNKGWFVALAIIIVIAAIAFTNKRCLQLQYADFKENMFSVNDNMYASKLARDISPGVGVRLLRLAKDDGLTQMVLSNVYLDTKVMLKSNNRYFGKFIGHEIRQVKYTDTSRLDNFYIIDINPNIVKKDTVDRGNHTYLNDKYYIEPIWVSNKQ